LFIVILIFAHLIRFGQPSPLMAPTSQLKISNTVCRRCTGVAKGC
jgi:hypothetical protein